MQDPASHLTHGWSRRADSPFITPAPEARTAAALGQVAVGIPCVIGGSASQGLLSFWEKQQ